jgi:3-phenylpropionate/trans-cinnamate dioxygenase ferredoxin reductase component
VPDAPRRIVIVGASLAGATAAVTLRKDGFEGGLALVGEEPRVPYERPELSKSYLRGEVAFEELLVRPADFWADHDVELRTGSRAVAIDVERRVVRLADGEELPFDRLLLATGCRNRTPAIPGADSGGVHLLRTVDECDRLRADAVAGRSVVVAGMSFIGSEVAASLRSLGLEVTAIVSDAFPLARIFGDEVGRVLDEIHRAHGVRLVANDRLASIEGGDRAEAVVTTNGERLPCDLAVLALGVEPATELADGTPIEVDDGILVDERCRTNVEGIFAAGDVARFHHPTVGRRMRIEHWQNARRHGRAAARNMLGADRPYDEVPWFWSDQYDHELQFAGFHGTWDAAEVRRDDGGLVAYFSGRGILEAAAAIDRPEAIRGAIPLIAAREPADAAGGAA